MTDRDPRAADPAATTSTTTPEAARLPVPEGGLGSHELDTDSNDPAVLRQHLQRAQERLSFYESFDRIIGENIKRSGELMLETIALREETQAADQVRVARESQIESERQAERAHTHALLTSLQDEIGRFQTSATSLAARVADALRDLDPQASVPAAPGASETAPVEPVVVETPAVSIPDLAAAEPAPLAAASTNAPGGFRPFRQEPTSDTVAADLPDDEIDVDVDESSEPVAEVVTAPTVRTIDLVVTGITRATTALAFQRELSARDGVRKVETREFAEGVLRLKVELADDTALSDAAIAGWSGPGSLTVSTRQPSMIALDFADA